MPQKAYLWILKIGAILSFICVFFVFRGLLFPYITSKQIPFNVLMEVLFVFWLAFVIKYPQWNPFRGFTKSWPFNLFFGKKKAKTAQPEIASLADKQATPAVRLDNKKAAEAAETIPASVKSSLLITFGLIAFFAVITISCFTGIDFYMSFWSNAERMLGVFHILHFFILYLIVITVMREWRDWLMTFIALILVAVFVAVGSLGSGGTNYSTLGNTLYASIFMIFAGYLVLITFFHKDSKEGKKNYSFWKWFLFLALLPVFSQFYKADNTGAYVGVGAGVAAFIFLLGIINKRRLVRIVSWAITAMLIAGFILIFTNHNNPLIAGNKILGQMNFEKNTFQTRLLSWKSAAKDFPNHWLIGTGFGNYAITFDKYFDAKFFTYSKIETYFDRAHNNLIDIASTTGVLGLAAYLSIFAAAGFYLIRLLRRRRIKPLEFCLISSLFVAYFVQNLTVFDSFISYLCLMIVLGYVNWLSNTEEDRGNERALLGAGGPKGFANKEIYALLAAGLVMAFTIYNYAILPLGMLSKVIEGQIAFSQRDIPRGIALYKEALSRNTPIDKDGRAMLLRAIANQSESIAKMNQAQAEDIISFAIDQGQKNLAYNQLDSLQNMELARVYEAGFKAIKNAKKKAEYAQKCLTYIDRSIAASPQRVPVYFVKTQFLIDQNKVDEAISTLEYVATISDFFIETPCQLGQIYLLKENSLLNSEASSSAKEIGDKGWAAMDKCLDNGGSENLVVSGIVKEAINHYLVKKDTKKVIALYTSLIGFEPQNTQYLIILARLYSETGDKAKAIATAEQIGAIDPKLKTDADEFIKQIKNSK